jgi:hypothetical protein
MGHSVLLGVSLVMTAGFMSGCCMLPVKFVRFWKWKNVWSWSVRMEKSPVVGGLVHTLMRGIPGTECFTVSDELPEAFRWNR